MEHLNRKNVYFKDGSVKLSDFMSGTTFTIEANDETEVNDVALDFSEFPDVENYLSPLDLPFYESKKMMTQFPEINGLWKKTVRQAPENSVLIDFSRHRVTYHRNLYLENEDYPFDSTFLNDKPDVICNDPNSYLEGIIDALSTMKEGERAHFIVSYKKMFKEEGCLPRVLPKADVFCDLTVLKVEEIGNQEYIDELEAELKIKTFEESKSIASEGRVRAKYLVQNKKFHDAIKLYKNILQMIQISKTENIDEENDKKQLIIQILINIATCYNLKQEPKNTISTISKIEELCTIDNQPKLFFIKGKALRMLGEYKEATVALKNADRLQPGNSDIMKEFEILEKKYAEYTDMSKTFSKKLFNSST